MRLHRFTELTPWADSIGLIDPPPANGVSLRELFKPYVYRGQDHDLNTPWPKSPRYSHRLPTSDSLEKDYPPWYRCHRCEYPYGSPGHDMECEGWLLWATTTRGGYSSSSPGTRSKPMRIGLPMSTAPATPR